MKVKFKKLSKHAVLPSYALEGDAGLDLTAIDVETHKNYIEYDTGIACEIPEGYVGLIFPRSSITNKKLMLKNSVGVIDSGYRGSIKFRFYFTPTKTGVIIENGMAKLDYEQKDFYSLYERIGQLIILPYPKIEVVEVDNLEESKRGEGGYGHTGK